MVRIEKHSNGSKDPSSGILSVMAVLSEALRPLLKHSIGTIITRQRLKLIETLRSIFFIWRFFFVETFVKTNHFTKPVIAHNRGCEIKYNYSQNLKIPQN